jgi:Ankyrin repeats (3 copies)
MYGKTAVMYAAQRHKAVLQLLLEKEANVRHMDADSQTALHWAARYGHEEMVGLLLEKGAILDATSRYGTALSWAADGAHDAVVRLLLKDHANINKKGGSGSWGGTPLASAAAWGHESTVLQLLENGADLEAKGEYGQIAMDGQEKVDTRRQLRYQMDGANVGGLDIKSLLTLCVSLGRPQLAFWPGSGVSPGVQTSRQTYGARLDVHRVATSTGCVIFLSTTCLTNSSQRCSFLICDD